MNVAITGGIGSGKTYVCRRLEALGGSSVYDCDAAAKRIMRTSEAVRRQLISLVGPAVYDQQTLQKRVLAAYILRGEREKQAVNDIVHPAVAADFLSSGQSWLESAILFESGFDRRISFDHIVCVSAPTDVRVSRITLRDHISTAQAQAWIDAQIPQQEMERRSQHVIVNDGTADIDTQIINILNKINIKV